MRIGLLVALCLTACKKAPPPPVVVVAPVVAPVEDDREAPAEPQAALPPRVRTPDLATPPPVDTMNGDPNGPRQAEFDGVQADGQRKVQACLDSMPATVVLPNGVAKVGVKFGVGNDGKPKDVAITTELPAEQSACAKTAIEGLSFPAFQGPIVNSAFSLMYNRAVAK